MCAYGRLRFSCTQTHTQHIIKRSCGWILLYRFYLSLSLCSCALGFRAQSSRFVFTLMPLYTTLCVECVNSASALRHERTNSRVDVNSIRLPFRRSSESLSHRWGIWVGISQRSGAGVDAAGGNGRCSMRTSALLSIVERYAINSIAEPNDGRH